ncbi:MAG: hypothetical protein ACOC9O_02100 [Myxococcota bacterium]
MPIEMTLWNLPPNWPLVRHVRGECERLGRTTNASSGWVVLKGDRGAGRPVVEAQIMLQFSGACIDGAARDPDPFLAVRNAVARVQRKLREASRLPPAAA